MTDTLRYLRLQPHAPLGEAILETLRQHGGTARFFQPKDLRLPAQLRSIATGRSPYFFSTEPLGELDPFQWSNLQDLARNSTRVVWWPADRGREPLASLLEDAEITEQEEPMEVQVLADIHREVNSLMLDQAWLILGPDGDLELHAPDPTLDGILRHGADRESERREQLEREVVELHEYFEGWFRGELTPEDFPRIEQSLTEDFELIDPGGLVHLRDPLVARLLEMHGAWDKADGIEIRQGSVHRIGGECYRVRYQEWHERGGEARGRESTAILEIPPSGAIRWHHVHETWLP